MRKKIVRGREMYLGVRTEEIINLFRSNPQIELECFSGVTRWMKYDQLYRNIQSRLRKIHPTIFDDRFIIPLNIV